MSQLITPVQTDESLAAAAQRGSTDAFEELVRRYQVPLLRFLLKRAPHPREAEDALQDAILLAWENINQYQPRWPFRSWVFTIAYRQAITLARRPRLRLSRMPETQGDRSPAPLDHLIADESRTDLWALAKRELSAEAFTALWLCYAEDLPLAQIARVLSRSEGSVKTMLHRARKRLEHCLAQPSGEGVGGARQQPQAASSILPPMPPAPPALLTGVKR